MHINVHIRLLVVSELTAIAVDTLSVVFSEQLTFFASNLTIKSSSRVVFTSTKWLKSIVTRLSYYHHETIVMVMLFGYMQTISTYITINERMQHSLAGPHFFIPQRITKAGNQPVDQLHGCHQGSQLCYNVCEDFCKRWCLIS